MGEDLAAVDSPPHEGVVWEAVILAPADFCGHETLDAGLLQQLRQGSIVSESVRKPQYFTPFAEFLLKKT